MKTYPLESISIEKAQEKQFRFVDCVMHHFSGSESLTRGDLGVHQPGNHPVTTGKAEAAIAEFFNSEDSILVRGSGTGAIRYGLSSIIGCGEKILVHKAPVYSTTTTSFEMFGLKTVEADFNNIDEIKKVLNEESDIKAALVQYSRQKIDDSYDMEEVIKAIKEVKDIPVITDDNYVVMKVNKIGVECGADLSCFSTFKLQGPEGIGCVVGKKEYVEKIRKMHYSGGCQVQGFEALEVIRGLTYAPVMLAITAKTAEDVLRRLKDGEVEGVKNAYIANAQSKVLLVEFDEPIAKKVLVEAEKMGALPNPVGAESKYEIEPLFYRVSGTFLKSDPTLADHMIRINPNRCGSDTVINILKESIKAVL
ncbi:MAG: aminotransferase class V-fold PLP-dependent enzyme [Erysipelotrichaceae bacterium]|nr:aminotransferase class V-fold PLP-dependent enzyme [Erysipelotrichaceae bacterium]